jgi:hypothetical protein
VHDTMGPVLAVCCSSQKSYVLCEEDQSDSTAPTVSFSMVITPVSAQACFTSHSSCLVMLALLVIAGDLLVVAGGNSMIRIYCLP